MTIGFADTCVQYCQEDYSDEFCSKYPPEGVPARLVEKNFIIILGLDPRKRKCVYLQLF